MNDNLLIQQVELYKLSIPLKEPFVTSLGTDVSADNVLVKIITNRGIIGFGEWNPYMPSTEKPGYLFYSGPIFAKR
jgi:L-alanine-DL-glutamate epimerase-like enolase superfamily enzyme